MLLPLHLSVLEVPRDRSLEPCLLIYHHSLNDLVYPDSYVLLMPKFIFLIPISP